MANKVLPSNFKEPFEDSLKVLHGLACEASQLRNESGDRICETVDCDECALNKHDPILSKAEVVVYLLDILAMNLPKGELEDG